MNNYSVLYSLDNIDQNPLTWFSEASLNDVSNEIKEWLKNRHPDQKITIISISKVTF